MEAKAKQRLVVCVSDLHGHPHNWVLQEVIALKPDIVVTAGDIFNMDAFSTHPRNSLQARPSFKSELNNVNTFFDKLWRKTDAVFHFIHGNHDDRFMKRLLELMNQDLEDLIIDPIDALISKLNAKAGERFFNTTTTFNNGMQSVHMLRLGDALISHNNFVGQRPGDAVHKLSTWVDEWDYTLKFNNPRLLVQAHTHKASLQVTKGGGRVLIETGYSAKPEIEEYKVQYNTKFKPGTLAFCSFKQNLINNKWITELSNKTCQVHFKGD